MDKQRERQCLDAVFGGIPMRVTECEEPDFVCDTEGGSRFGVEVTEFYRAESDARLARIPAYAADLLKGAAYRHKDDQHEISVEDVVYRHHATGEELKIKAIPRKVPSHSITIPLLLDRIATKNVKIARYAESVSPVDLIVDDVDRFLRLDSVRQLLGPLFTSAQLNQITRSGFREIYLLTTHNVTGTVLIPLRANLIGSEAALFTRAYRDLIRASDQKHSVRDFLTAFAVHLSKQLPEVMYDVVDGVPRFIFGSIAWTLTRKQTVDLIDISSDPIPNAKLLAPDVAEDALPPALCNLLEGTRRNNLASYELCFPIHQKVADQVAHLAVD